MLALALIERDYVCGLCGLRNTYLTMFEHMQSMHPDDLSNTPINQLVKLVLQESPENPRKKIKYQECFVKMEAHVITNTEYKNIDQEASEKVDLAECDIEVVDQNKIDLDLVLSSSD